MAAKSYQAGFKRCYGGRLSNLSHETTENEIQQIYDDWAKEYEKDVVVVARAIFHKPLAESLDEAIRRFLAGKEKDEVKIMDAAAGTGLVGVELNKLGYTNLCALDISPEMLNEAKKKNVYKKFICSSLSDRPNPEIAPEEFDALICGGSMLVGHIGPSALIEMIRIIKIGGLVCFNIRDGQLEDYQEKISELESLGSWKLISKRSLPFFESDDMPRETFLFICQVLDSAR